MDGARFLRALRARWWVIAAIAIVGAFTAFIGATVRNNTITPVFQAEAPITIFPDQTQIVDSKGVILDSVLQQLDNAKSLATTSNSAFLASHPHSSIRSDANLGRLTFVAQAADPDEAQSLAGEMRANYMNQEPLNLQAQLGEQIDAVTAQLDGVRQSLSELDIPTEEQIKTESERARLTGLVSSLRAQQTSLEQQLLFPASTTLLSGATPEEIQAELDSVQSYLATYEQQLADLPPADDRYTTTETLRRALQREYQDLEVEYQNLFLQQNQARSSGTVEVIDVFDQTPPDIPVSAATGIGLIVGAAAAFLGVALSDRLRMPVWSARDAAPLKVLAQVPPRRGRTDQVWYAQQAAGNERKRSLQGFRAALMARFEGRANVVGLAGVDADAVTIHEFAADLAVSLVAADLSVLLVDCDFDATVTVTEIGNSDPTFSSLLESPPGVLEGVFDSLPSPFPGLRSIAAGERPTDAIDAVAGKHFLGLLDEFRTQADVTLLVLPDVGPMALTALRRLDKTVLVLTPGASRIPSLTDVANEMDASGAPVLGAVMVDRRSGLRDRIHGSVKAPTPQAPPARIARTRSVYETRPLGGAEPVGDLSRPRETVHVATGGNPGRRETADEEETDAWGKDMSPSTAAALSSLPTMSSIFGQRLRADLDETDEPTDEPTIDQSTPDDLDETGEEIDEPTIDELHTPSRPVDATNDAAAYDAVPKVLELLRDRIRRILTGSIDDETLRAEVVPILDHQGFIPIVRVRKHQTLGDLVRMSLRQEVALSKRRTFERSLRGVLKQQLDVDQGSLVDLINKWTEASFFADELAHSEEPTLWHLTSPQGAFQTLIHNQLFSRQHLEVLLKDLTRVRIDMLTRRARSVKKSGDPNKAARLEEDADDVRSFRETLKELLEETPWDALSSGPDGQPLLETHAPGYSEGLTKTLDSLERLGLLPMQALDKDRLAQLSPPLGE